MKLSNQLIYNYAYNLVAAFNDQAQVLPVKINFYLQRNKKELIRLAQELEEERENLFKQYGEYNPKENNYIIPVDKQEFVKQQFNDLLALEQEVNIYKVKFTDFSNDINLTVGQMDALMFMIEDEE